VQQGLHAWPPQVAHVEALQVEQETPRARVDLKECDTVVIYGKKLEKGFNLNFKNS
jgi:hypothetical protein